MLKSVSILGTGLQSLPELSNEFVLSSKKHRTRPILRRAYITGIGSSPRFRAGILATSFSQRCSSHQPMRRRPRPSARSLRPREEVGRSGRKRRRAHHHRRRSRSLCRRTRSSLNRRRRRPSSAADLRSALRRPSQTTATRAARAGPRHAPRPRAPGWRRLRRAPLPAPRAPRRKWTSAKNNRSCPSIGRRDSF